LEGLKVSYKLDNSFTRGRFTVMVVGCGGTGGYVAESLCRLLPPEATLVLVDHDRVEERNLARQNFFPGDIGQIKSKATALRLARKYGRPVAYSVYPVVMTEIHGIGIVVGCVDNGAARRDIAAKIRLPGVAWWVDTGNGENYGQVLIGNSQYAFFNETKGICIGLPSPTIQRPDLLNAAPLRQPDCARVAEQGPTINQTMAAVVIEVVRRLIEGTCPWIQLYLDMEAGTLHPVLATPEEVEKIIGKKKVRISQATK